MVLRNRLYTCFFMFSFAANFQNSTLIMRNYKLNDHCFGVKYDLEQSSKIKHDPRILRNAMCLIYNWSQGFGCKLTWMKSYVPIFWVMTLYLLLVGDHITVEIFLLPPPRTYYFHDCFSLSVLFLCQWDYANTTGWIFLEKSEHGSWSPLDPIIV